MKSYIVVILLLSQFTILNAQVVQHNNIPFSTSTTNLTIWNGTEYIPFFMKGVNLGIAVPGTFPGELAATKKQYAQWFQEIKDAGFNCIRLYTLHYPVFYEVLDSFNVANKQNPLLFIQGIWLNEEIDGYTNDLYELSEQFTLEIADNISCVHGSRIIAPRYGKAFGTYTHNVSQWCLAYILGREIYPQEIATTNMNHTNIDFFEGRYFSIYDTWASEIWLASMLNYTVDFEQTNFHTQRPVSASSWPTLDPIRHLEEQNIDEDKEQINFSKLQVTNAPAGFFISYHAYPYYPDFVSQQASYNTKSDEYGPNSYLGYLLDLKSHYPKFPLIIAEYGVPSSWGVAHYASSGMNHGGFDEFNQGLTNLRMLQTIETAQCGGGIQFSWIDEWFKRTWITDHIDYNPDARVRWHNITAAEQNFGLKKFTSNEIPTEIQNFGTTKDIQSIKALANFAYLDLEIALKSPLQNIDNMWIAFDTYADTLGESLLPNGDTIPFRSEFILQLNNYSASLFVTQAYDLFGKYHDVSDNSQVYHSTKTDGALWNIVRWKNNNQQSDVQYIGNLQVNYDFQIPSSKDAVVISNDKVTLHIPWSLLQFVDPSTMKVCNDNKYTATPEDTLSKGINIAIQYKNQWFSTNQRFTWNNWNSIDNSKIEETYKTSYWIMQNGLQDYNSDAIAVRDTFLFNAVQSIQEIGVEQGLLHNDFDIDGNTMVALVTQNLQHGYIELHNDGSFLYEPEIGFNGIDSMQYCIFDGTSLSKSNTVLFNVQGNTNIETVERRTAEIIDITPNPCTSYFEIETYGKCSNTILFTESGIPIMNIPDFENSQKVDISSFPSGTYILVTKTLQGISSGKIIKL